MGAIVPDFAGNTVVAARLRIQKARRERFVENLNQRRGLVSLTELVETSAKEVLEYEEEEKSNQDEDDGDETFDPMDIDNNNSEMSEMSQMMANFGQKRNNNQKKRKPKKQKKLNRNQQAPSKNLRIFARQLQLWDFLVEEDLPMLDNNFLMFTRPEGDRCLVLSGQGTTIARCQRGFVSAKFESGLPGGGNVQTQNNETAMELEDEEH